MEAATGSLPARAVVGRTVTGDSEGGAESAALFAGPGVAKLTAA
jgi:hypothetical protein